MHRTTLLASTLAVLLAGSTSFAIAQNTSTPTPSSTANAMPARTGMPMRMQAGERRFRGARGHGMQRPRSGVIADLHSLERLYEQAGRSKDLTAVYNDVLARSQDPRVRNYVYHRLARLQARPANVDQSIATLRKSLDENLANAAKMRSQREQMRSKWQQRQSGTADTPATDSAG